MTDNEIEYERMWELIDNHKAEFDINIHNKMSEVEKQWNKFKAKIWGNHFGDAYIDRHTFERLVNFLKNEKVIEQGFGEGLYSKLLRLKGINNTLTETSPFLQKNFIKKDDAHYNIPTHKYLINNKNNFTAIMFFFPSFMIETLNEFKGNKIVYCGKFYFGSGTKDEDLLPMGDTDSFEYINDNFIIQRAYPAYETLWGYITFRETLFFFKKRSTINNYKPKYLEFLKEDKILQINSGFGSTYDFLYKTELNYVDNYIYYFKNKTKNLAKFTNLLIVYPFDSMINLLKNYEGSRLSLVGRFGDYEKNKAILEIGIKEDIDYIKEHFELIKEYPIVNDPEDWYSFYAFKRKN